MIVDKIQSCLDQQQPFVLFKKKEADCVHFIVHDSEEKGNRFVFAPFVGNSLNIFFKKKQSIPIETLGEAKALDLSVCKSSSLVFQEDKKAYIKKITQAITAIKQQRFSKVVLSRPIVLDQKINVLQSFHRMLQNNPQALGYLWYHPSSGIWMGATPEILLLKHKSIIQTMSLAGTKSEEESWGNKEYEEQAVVTQYIVNTLKPFTKNISLSDLREISQNNFKHLQTIISGEMIEDKLEEVLEKLHPTPAVCGFPTDLVRDYILAVEEYPRQFYTGYLGEMSLNQAAIYVNLRCAKINHDQVKLFVGGGINHLSDPEEEWQETLLKSAVIKKCLIPMADYEN